MSGLARGLAARLEMTSAITTRATWELPATDRGVPGDGESDTVEGTRGRVWRLCTAASAA